jgi:alpha-galactosidase
VTDVPNLDGRATPLQYRFLVAMQGALGIGNNLNKWTNEDFALGTKLTALYKTIRATGQQGSLYRLTQPLRGDQNNEEGASQVEYVARDVIGDEIQKRRFSRGSSNYCRHRNG